MEPLVMSHSEQPASGNLGKRQIPTLGEVPSHARQASDREGSKVLENGSGDVDVTILASLTPVNDFHRRGFALVSECCSLPADAAAVEGTGSQSGNAVVGGVISTTRDLVAGGGFVIGHLADFSGCSKGLAKARDHEKSGHGDCVGHHFDGVEWYSLRYCLLDLGGYIALVQTGVLKKFVALEINGSRKAVGYWEARDVSPYT